MGVEFGHFAHANERKLHNLPPFQAARRVRRSYVLPMSPAPDDVLQLLRRRGRQPEHGVPHVSAGGIPIDRVQRSAGMVVPESES